MAIPKRTSIGSPARSSIGGATKRSSTAGAAQHAANKKRKCSDVSAALKGATLEAFSGATLRMLANAVSDSLGEPKADRHAFQSQIADMVGKVLSGMEKGVEAEILAAQAEIDGADGKKASLDSAMEAAEQTLAAKKEAAIAANAAHAEAKHAKEAAIAALKAAEKEQSSGDAQLTDAAAQKAKLEDSVANMFNPLKSGGTCEDKTAVKSLGKVGRDLKLDELLLEGLLKALKTAPAERGSWDSYAMGEFEAAINKQINELDATLASGETDKAACAAAVEAAKTSAAAADATFESSATELKDASAAEHEAGSFKKDAAQAVKMFEPELRKATAASAALKVKLDTHQTGPMAAFQELLELTEFVPPAPEPEPVEEPLATSPGPTSPQA